MESKNKELNRIINAYKFSMQGLKHCYQSETAFKQEIWLAIVLIPLAFLLTDSILYTVLLIIPIFVILIVELLNSAIENTINRIGKEYHALSKVAKDTASAAVFLSFVLLAVVWLIILI